MRMMKATRGGRRQGGKARMMRWRKSLRRSWSRKMGKRKRISIQNIRRIFEKYFSTKST